jgi:hypothetical protein
MNHPVGPAGPTPASVLKIQGDQTQWGLRTVPPLDPGWNDGPVAIDIITPVAGTLILSPTRVGSFALTAGIYGNGWQPGGPAVLVAPYLYIPNVAGLTTTSPGYPLAADSNLTDLRQSIMDAMTTGSTVSVNVDVFGGGVVILNGAQLPFAVLAEVQTN